ncbi:MAG: NADH-quinone oxidoreductase subunit NuoG [Actinomycetota bacterium]
MTDTVDTDAELDEVEPEPEPEPDPNAVAVTINGKEVVATKGQLIIEAAKDQGAYVPHFCYHPRMQPVGMCRQCLVEVDTGRGPQLMPSCMFPVSDDMVIDTESDTVKRAQEGMLELLLANHPLDCPVCDKGGECPLQDQAFSHGPGESRYLEEKRHYEKPIPISDLVLLDRERCILCDRCTRFADEIAGDKLIHFTQRGNQTQVMTFPDEPFASYFSGNTVQICPVGALTAEPYRFKARPWDLDQQESTCMTCSTGCRMVVQSSRDEVLRYQGVDSDPVNHGWLNDRCRFNFEALSSEHRLTEPLVTTDAGLTPTTWSAAMSAVGTLIRRAVDAGGASSVALLGGARGTNEDAFAWAQLADGLGIEYRDPQLGDGLPAEILSLPRATIDDACAASTLILLGPDVKEELATLHLRLRGAAESGTTKIIEIAANETGLRRQAWRSIRPQPGRQASAVRELLADPEVTEQLASGDVVVLAGRGNLAESPAATMAALAELLDAVPDAKVLPGLRRGNVVGALSVGLAPADADHDATSMLEAAADGRIELLILLGADPLSDHPDHDLARRALAGARSIVSIDTFPTESTRQADVVLPAAAYTEKAGSTTNIEGRVNDVTQRTTARGTSRPDWMVAAELALDLDDLVGDLPIAMATTVDDVTDSLAATVPGFAAATATAVTAAVDGVLVELPTAGLTDRGAEAGVRNSYDHRLVVSRKLYDRAIGTAMSRGISNLAVTAAAHVHPLDADQLGATDGADVRLVAEHASVVLPLRLDARIERGNVWVPFNAAADHGGGCVESIIDARAAVTDVRIEVL